MSNGTAEYRRQKAPVNGDPAPRAAEAVKPRPKWLLLVCAILIPLAIYALSGAGERRAENEAFDNGGITYSGGLIGGKFTGYGKLVFENGDIYTGGFLEGRFDGRGSYFSSKGWQVEGNFSNGRIDGESDVFTAGR